MVKKDEAWLIKALDTPGEVLQVEYAPGRTRILSVFEQVHLRSLLRSKSYKAIRRIFGKIEGIDWDKIDLETPMGEPVE